MIFFTLFYDICYLLGMVIIYGVGELHSGSLYHLLIGELINTCFEGHKYKFTLSKGPVGVI